MVRNDFVVDEENIFSYSEEKKMPNHWESSARPLFVKTLFVNGSRHAILSQEDPILLNIRKHNIPHNSIRLGSRLSISSSESQGSSSERDFLHSKLENFHRYHREDVSTELQNCLTKLRLASSEQKNRTKNKGPKIFYEEQDEMKWNLNEQSKNYKRKKGTNSKIIKNKNNAHYYQDSIKENTYTEVENRSKNCYYVYGLENTKGKKNYCCVKIGSRPPQYILNCNCDKNSNFRETQHTSDFTINQNETHTQDNNKLFSATFQDLILTMDKNEKLLQSLPEYFFPFTNSDSQELSWNNYLAKSYYNSLCDRVVQWLNLARKKKGDKLEVQNGEVSLESIERVFAGERFIKESKISVKNEKPKIIHKESLDKDIETEVKGEDNVETALSIESINNKNQNGIEILKTHITNSLEPDNNFTEQNENILNENHINEESLGTSCTPKSNPNSCMTTISPDPITWRFCNSVENIFKSEQKLPSENDFNENLSYMFGHNKKRNYYDKHNASAYQSYEYLMGSDPGKVEEWKTPEAKCLQKNMANRKNKNNEMLYEYVGGKEMYIWEKKSEERAKKMSLKSLSQKYKDKNNKSMIIQNFTRKFFNNEFSLQHQNKILWLRESKYSGDGDIGKPQLHIFMPPVPSKDQSDESVSECESFLSEIS